MKKLIAIIFVIAGLNISGQSIFEKYKNSESVLIDSLVNLTLQNNPQKKIYESRVDLAKENHSQAKLSWFDNMNLSYQYNPNTQNTSGSTSVPRFGIGLSLNIGNILNTPSRINQTNEEIKIAEADYENNINFLRAEVIRRYANYKRSVDLLVVRDQAVNDSESSMILIKHRFESGETDLEEYNKALRSYTDNMERKVVAEGDVVYHKASLEEIIGRRLEELN